MGKRRGDISKRIRSLCYELSQGKITEREFKNGIQELIDEYGTTGYMLQDIGMAAQKWCSHMGNYVPERFWVLLDEVDTRIRESYEKSKEKITTHG